MPVMGNLQEMFDQPIPRTHGAHPNHTEWMRAQLEEFVRKIFMRISSFRTPDVFVDTAHPTPPPCWLA